MKIYVEILTPGNGKKYEIAMDDKSTAGQAKEKIIQEITDFEGGKEVLSLGENLLLYSKEAKLHIPDHKNIRSAGIKSGQTLILA